MLRARLWFPYLFLAYWAAFFFPSWYALTYTKVWELRRLVFRSPEQQMKILHSGAMSDLLALRDYLQTLPVDSTYVILGPGSKDLPLAGNPAMARAVLFPYTVGLPEMVPENTRLVVQLDTSCLKQQVSELPFGARWECWEIRP